MRVILSSVMTKVLNKLLEWASPRPILSDARGIGSHNGVDV